MRWRAMFAALVLPFTSASAQDGSVWGVVRSSTGAPLPGVDVVVSDLTLSARSDSAGRYRVRDVTKGTHLVIARRIGLRPDSVRLFVKAGQDYEHDFQLESDPVNLDTVTSTAPEKKYISPGLRSFEDRRRKGIGHFISEDELRKRDNLTLAQLLAAMPGMAIVPYKTSDFARATRASGGGGFAIIGGRPGGAGGCDAARAIPCDRSSPRGCWVAVYLDGLRVYAGGGEPVPDLATMYGREYSGIEFYAGGASLPAEFSAIKASDCGVMLLWTREH